ncbi:aminopeptidase-like domain-containing protein [Nonomuraea wenchangensis]|uniref:Aminopeptidase-like domain-containing protein n=2 Tax=Nonomuraea wenchangensis TaxID=568860 RepID=A0A1I0LIU4_9ACTN|nr:aminopeptidase-like domain-containing protein [Nonomuraea wenchangensis]
MHDLVRRLYPLCRSITGDGVRGTLEIVGEHLPLTVREVPTGTEVLDWTVPKEWNVRDAYVKDASGRRVIDFRESNLHVVGYSVPVAGTYSLAELRPRLHTLPEQPGLVPYRTSYYAETWGFCLSQDALDRLRDEDGPFEVRIDSTLAPGSLTYGEYVVPGRLPEEVMISCHVCHPSLANDNLAGIAVAVALARRLREPRHTYRFLFAPGTIGAITWLARNRERLHLVAGGLTLACAGDPGALTYKRSRRGDALIDRAVTHVLRGRPHEVLEFSPYGYDERQFCSPGFDLPFGSLTRTPYAGYPEYHTSGDNPDFVTPQAMEDTLDALTRVVEVLEHERTYLNLSPYGEPQLGRRGLYGSLGGRSDTKQAQMAMLWVLNLSDGEHGLLDIADRSGLPFAAVKEAAQSLLDAGLLKEKA